MELRGLAWSHGPLNKVIVGTFYLFMTMNSRIKDGRRNSEANFEARRKLNCLVCLP